MQQTNIEAADELHSDVMGILKGEMGLVRPNITKVTDTVLVVTTARHRADALIDCVASLNGYVVTDEEQIPKQPRDMTRYNSVRIKRIND